MKQLIILAIFTLLLFGCKKNELEDVTIGENVWETENNYIEVTRARNINCTIAYFDVEVYEDKLPDNIEYTHLHIVDSKGNSFITEKRKNIAVSKRCNPPNQYLISLYNDSLQRKSAHIVFNYEL